MFIGWLMLYTLFRGSIAIEDDFFIIEPLQSDSTLSLEEIPHVIYHPSGRNFNVTSSHCGVLDVGYQVLNSEESNEISSSNSQGKANGKLIIETFLIYS